jgi:hypothetical protein
MPLSEEEKDFDQANKLTKGRQRFFRRPKKPANIISQLMARKGYCQTQSANELSEVWQQAVGDKWKNKTKAGNVNRGVLEVFVANAAVNQKIGFEKRKILAALKQRVPQNKITDIKFRVGSVDHNE